MVDQVVHFEIPADNPARAKAFYEKLFGWKITYSKEFDYYMVEARDKSSTSGMGSIDGGMMKRKMPRQPFTNYIHVASVDAALKKVKANGGKVCMPRTSLGTMGAIATFTDPEGNFIGLHEMSAKGQQQMEAAHKAAKASMAKASAKKATKPAKKATPRKKVAKPVKKAAKKKKQ